MKTRDMARMLDQIEKKAEALHNLRAHTSDHDLLRTAVNSLANAVSAYLEATE